jgi:D-xylose transport system permease protein
VLVVLWAGLAVYPGTRAAFLTSGNLSNITAQIAELVIVSVGMTFVVLTRGIDLSIGAGMALFGVVAATLQIEHDVPAPLAIAVVLGASVLMGLWHGLLVARLRVPPIIATLSSLLAYRGLALLLSGARGLSPMRPDFAFLGGRIPAVAATAVCVTGLVIGIGILLEAHWRRKAFGLPTASPWVLGARGLMIGVVAAVGAWIYQGGMPVPVLIAAVVTSAGALLLVSSRLGRHAFAIGGNPEAARLSGIDVRKVTVGVYAILGVLTALAGLLLAARVNGVTPGSQGNLLELDAVTAVVIGGTSLLGGRGSITGTVLGTLVFSTLSNGMNLLGIDSNWQWICTGNMLLAAALIDVLSKGKRS